MLLNAMVMTKLRIKYLEFSYPIMSDSLIIVIKNNLDKVNDYGLFFDILNHETWVALLGLCLLPAIIIRIQDELMETEKFTLKKFIFHLFESNSYNLLSI